MEGAHEVEQSAVTWFFKSSIILWGRLWCRPRMSTGVASLWTVFARLSANLLVHEHRHINKRLLYLFLWVKKKKNFTKDSFKQNLVVRSMLGSSFKLRQLVVKKDAVLTIFVGRKIPCDFSVKESNQQNSGEQLRNSIYSFARCDSLRLSKIQHI